MAEDARFVIDGVEYPVPTFDTFNLDEMQVLYDCSGYGLEDFAIDEDNDEEVEERDRKAKSPGILKSQVVIALTRGTKEVPRRSRKQAMELVGRMNFVELLAAIEAEEDPTEPQKSEEPKSPISTSSDEKPDSSGTNGSTSSESLTEETPVSTGTSESDTPLD
jgi:hypothetical protein